MLNVDGSPLRIDDVVTVARQREAVGLSDVARERMRPSRALVERLQGSDAVVYGITTGFGALADQAIAVDDRAALQVALLRSHAAGSGEPLPADVVRGMILLRARSLAAGRAGVRPLLVEAMLALLNAGITPWVPAHGSMGASGDLAPLAHAATALIGEGDVLTETGTRITASEALAAAGLAPINVDIKEGLALINGTEGMTAILALALHDTHGLLRLADAACAMSVEALLGTTAPFDADLIALRPSPGQAASAANLRSLLEGSEIVASHRGSRHAVQDAYSLRCAPQVHGAARDLADMVHTAIDREMASVVDNPVVMTERGRVLSTGNFHGQALAYAADMLAMMCADLAAISERRVNRLLDPARSRGLPAFLVPDPGLNSGLMITQYSAAAMVSSLRQMASPLSVHSLDSSAGQEDHVSMGFEAALRTRGSVELLQRVLAIEVLCAAQALDLRAPLPPAPATAALRDSVRCRVAFLERDRHLGADVEAITQWSGGEWMSALRGELV